MPASRRVSQRQLELLVAFAEANKDVALGRCSRGPQANQITHRAWETVANRLNAVADGVTKTAEQWRRYWVEWKAKTKAKAADVRRNASKTGGGPNNVKPLNELEERILQLIGRVSVEGLPGVRIPFRIPSETLVPPSQPSTSQATDYTSQASTSTSQMEVEWLEEEYEQPLPQPSPEPLTIALPSPSPHSLPPHRLQTSPPHRLQTSPPHRLQTSPPHQQQSPQQRQSRQTVQSSPRLRSRQRLIYSRDRDVPQWARCLEERRIDMRGRFSLYQQHWRGD